LKGLNILDPDCGKYDLRHPGIYSVLEDKGVQLNSKVTTGYKSSAINSEVGLVIGDRTLHVKADGSIQIGYKDPASGGATISTLNEGQTILLDDGASVTRTKGNIVVQTSEYKMQFSPGKYKSDAYLNIDVWSKAGGVMSDGVAPQGILGELFDEDHKPQFGLKNTLETYRATSLFGSGSTAPNLPHPTPTDPVLPNKLPSKGYASYKILELLLKEVSADGNYTAAELKQASRHSRVKGSVYEPVLYTLAKLAEKYNKSVTSAHLKAIANKVKNDDFLSEKNVKDFLPELAGWEESKKSKKHSKYNKD
jgi:hypothetical protein